MAKRAWAEQMPSPEHTAKADQFYKMSGEIFDYYVSAIEHDMNVYVQEHGGKSMDLTFAHNDLTRILFKDIEHGNLAGIVAYAVLEKIRGKTGGR